MSRVVNINNSEYDVYIGRPSKWGNPFSSKEGTLAKFKVINKEDSINKYEEWITNGEGKHLQNDLIELKNKRLGCFCYPEKCHGNILIKLINKKILKGLL